MKNIKTTFLPLKFVTGSILLLVIFASCTSSRWVIKEKQAVDPDDYQLIDAKPQLVRQGELSPENPVLQLTVNHVNTYRYKEKVLAERYIQEYKPRWVYTGISLASAAAMFYTANSDRMINKLSKRQSLAINAFGGFLALSTFLNMEPSGEPVKTGETRFKRVTGTREITRTEQSSDDLVKRVHLSLIHAGDTLVKRREVQVGDSVINLNLVEITDVDRFDEVRKDSIALVVGFRGADYRYEIPVQRFLTPYVQVQTEFSELHNTPERDESNVLTDLAQNSMLELVQSVNEQWYKVKFGIKETYIDKANVRLVWRPASFEQRESIVTLNNIPFGEVDVESNVPVLDKSNPHGIGWIITGENYTSNLPIFKHALRDGKLIELYLRQALGYPAQSIHKVNNFSMSSDLGYHFGQIQYQVRADTSTVNVYISGHVTIRESDGNYQYYLVPVDLENYQNAGVDKMLDLKDFFRRLSKLEARKIVVWADLEFHNLDSMLKDPENIRIIRPLASIARKLTEYHPRSAVIFSSGFDQSSSLYYQKEGEDKKHRLFAYYLARSLQLRNSRLANIMDYMERNLNYTSRKLHGLPQNPRFFGNDDINLIDPE